MAVDLLNTKFSNVDLVFAKAYLQIEPDWTEDDILVQSFLNASKSYVLNYSKLTIEELDAYNEMIIPYLQLVSDFYHDRSARGKEQFSETFEALMSLHRTPSL